MARFDPELSQWIRYLYVTQQLPTAHVAAVLGRDPAFVSDYFERQGQKLPFVPSGPPRRNRRPGPHQLILGRTGTRIRVLRDLGYDAARIAGILGLDPDQTAEFLQRLKPTRPASFRRPRERNRNERLRARYAIDTDSGAPHPPPVRPGEALVTTAPSLAHTEALAIPASQAELAPPHRNEWVGDPLPYGDD